MEDLPASQSSYEIILLQAEKCYLTGQENYNAGKLFRDGDGNKYKRAKAFESFKSAAEQLLKLENIMILLINIVMQEDSILTQEKHILRQEMQIILSSVSQKEKEKVMMIK